MKLSLFLTDLLQDGNVVLPRTVGVFTADDSAASLVILEELYNLDRLNLPRTAPIFDGRAALWAAGYIFYVCHLILLRDVDEAVMVEYLKAFDGGQTAEVVYSADLLLRFLPDLFRLASGLSPEDPLVANMRQTAVQWPFSAIGLKEVDTKINTAIFNNACLRYAYIDRITQCKDVSKLQGLQEKGLLTEVLGEHQAVLWPGLELLNI